MATVTRDVTADAQAILEVTGSPASVSPTVPALLSASRTAHEQYLRLSQHWTPSTGQINPNADVAQAQTQIIEAARLRAYAQILDPSHRDPAWAQEAGTSYESDRLLPYYRRIVVDGASFGGFRR